MELEETPRAGLKRRTVDAFDKTPKAGSTSSSATPKQAYQAYNAVQRKQQQILRGNNSRDSNDPFQALRLPSASSMNMGGGPQHSPPQAQPRQHIYLELPLKNSSDHVYQHRGSIHDEEGSSSSEMPPQSPFQQTYAQQQQLPNSANAPFIPTLEAAAAHPQQVAVCNNAPRSMLIEELQLMKMESGNVAHWGVRNDVGEEQQQHQHPPQLPHQSYSSSSAFSVASDSNHLEYEAAEETDNDDDDDNPNDPRKSINHKRDDLTKATDATSSLQSSIDFRELQLQEVIGGGGFGQVWRALWNGTPVAVKVLTGSAQAKHVSKSILQEFVAEINLLKVSLAMTFGIMFFVLSISFISFAPMVIL